MDLRDYILEHTTRGECKCGKCIDMQAGTPDPTTAHTVDLVFFKVAPQNSPSKDEFVRLTKEVEGEFATCDPLDGQEHGYIELGAWIGSQELALLYMALGTALGVFKLFTPKTMLKDVPEPLARQMAGMGYVTVAAEKLSTVANAQGN